MASYIKTLKEDNGDITYPQTLASAVFIGNSDVETEMGKYVMAEDIASTSALTPVISTSMIQDGAVTAAKLDPTMLDGMGSYSTSEQATPFTWIDGKTIYKKTVDVGALPNNSAKSVAHGVTGLDYVIKIEGIIKASWGTQYCLPTVYDSDGTVYNTYVGVDSTNITIGTKGNNDSKSGYVTIWYTKSS